MNPISTEPVLILNWMDLPEFAKNVIAADPRFANDIYLEFGNEFTPLNENELYADTLTWDNITKWWNEQREKNQKWVQDCNNVQDFIKVAGLELEEWLLKNNVDLRVRKILIRISW